MLLAGLIVVCLIILFPVFSLFGRRAFQKAASQIAHTYWSFMVKNVEIYGRKEVAISGDPIPLRETAIIIANHRWGLDWLMIFSLAARKGMLGVCKFFAKDSVKWVPGIGWGIWLLDFPFLARNWTEDSRTIDRTFENFTVRKLPFWLVSHLEGTRISDSKVKKSQEFAKKKDLPVLKHVLLPRTKGFIATVQAFKRNKVAKAVYDITIMYEDGTRPPLGLDVALRNPSKVSLHVRRWKIDDLPNTDEELNSWVLERWKEKDALIETFLKTGEFPDRRHEPFRVAPLVLD
jgi:1-acyl-sn-glycerol-3-phosphate acyltransferase